jgi:hypothetical protein
MERLSYSGLGPSTLSVQLRAACGSRSGIPTVLSGTFFRSLLAIWVVTLTCSGLRAQLRLEQRLLRSKDGNELWCAKLSSERIVVIIYFTLILYLLRQYEK